MVSTEEAAMLVDKLRATLFWTPKKPWARDTLANSTQNRKIVFMMAVLKIVNTNNIFFVNRQSFSILGLLFESSSTNHW
jgi:hypothetical protein